MVRIGKRYASANGAVSVNGTHRRTVRYQQTVHIGQNGGKLCAALRDFAIEEVIGGKTLKI